MPKPVICHFFPPFVGPFIARNRDNPDIWDGLKHLQRINGDLAEYETDIGFNGVWIGPWHEATEIVDSRGLVGSIYAAKDHFMMDPRWSNLTVQERADMSVGEVVAHDMAALWDFTSYARAARMQVWADLVMNQVAFDHPLYTGESVDADHPYAEVYQTALSHPFYQNGRHHELFRTSHEFPDVAEIAWDHPDPEIQQAVRDIFIPFFKAVIDYYETVGCNAYRCDIAYNIPGDVWQEIISFTKQEYGDTRLFLAETVGGPAHKIDQLEGAGFDYAMSSTRWVFPGQHSDADHYISREERDRLHRIAPQGVLGYGSATHDDGHTLAGAFPDRRVLTREAMRAIIGNEGAILVIGAELGAAQAPNVFRTDEDLTLGPLLNQGSPLDITKEIAHIISVKRTFPEMGPNMTRHVIGLDNHDFVIMVRSQFRGEPEDMKQSALVLVMNADPSHPRDLHIGRLSEKLGRAPGEILVSLPREQESPEGETLRVEDFLLLYVPPSREQGRSQSPKEMMLLRSVAGSENSHYWASLDEGVRSGKSGHIAM